MSGMGTQVDVERALVDFHKARKTSDDFTGPKGYQEFDKACDTLAKDLGGPTYKEYCEDESD